MDIAATILFWFGFCFGMAFAMIGVSFKWKYGYSYIVAILVFIQMVLGGAAMTLSILILDHEPRELAVPAYLIATIVGPVLTLYSQAEEEPTAPQ